MNDAASRARQGCGRALGAPLIKKCAILATGNALDQLYAGKCDECCMDAFPQPLLHSTVARELAPVGLRSSPILFKKKLGPLRDPTGASSLATGCFLPFQSYSQCPVTYDGLHKTTPESLEQGNATSAALCFAPLRLGKVLRSTKRLLREVKQRMLGSA
ncbi:hypothetical protein CI807_12895 [Pseudomonas sp. NS1(2017)]|nr:hypothetical protein CI807_12895 [Pseudomonas sp. NS1(2017)]